MTDLDTYGSHIVLGGKYSVLHARGPVFGPTYHRQRLANKHGAVCYVEGHLNAVQSESTNYATAILSEKATDATKRWAKDYGQRVAAKFEIPAAQLVIGGRGAGNIAQLRMPAFLAEPGFVSNPGFVRLIRTGEGLDGLAKALADSIREAFPDGGLVALSVGHKYRGTGDMGANVNQRLVDPDPGFDQEAELVEPYIMATSEFLRGSR